MNLLDKADDFPKMSDQDVLCDLAFAVGILTYMIELNVKLQEKDQFLNEITQTTEPSFILKANVKQVLSLFPQNGLAEIGTST